MRAPLQSPSLGAIAAGLLFLTGVINSGTVLLLCSGMWLAWWIAVIFVLIRWGFDNSPDMKYVMRSLLIGCVFNYGVIWGVSLI